MFFLHKSIVQPFFHDVIDLVLWPYSTLPVVLHMKYMCGVLGVLLCKNTGVLHV